MKINKYIVTSILLYSSTALAQACPTSLIEKGIPAPCQGYMLSVGAIEEAAKLPKQIKLLEEKIQLQTNDVTLLNEKLKLKDELLDKKDGTILSLQDKMMEKDKYENLKIGLAAGGTGLAVSLVAIALAFAFGKASK